MAENIHLWHSDRGTYFDRNVNIISWSDKYHIHLGKYNSIGRDCNFFLHKFYIVSESSKKGIGTTIMNKFQHILQPKSITLTVNRQNFKSINFYFKNGFKIKSVEDFDIGNDYQMNDFVMVKYYN